MGGEASGKQATHANESTINGSSDQHPLRFTRVKWLACKSFRYRVDEGYGSGRLVGRFSLFPWLFPCALLSK